MKDKILIAYYSHSGNTEKIARIIKEKTGGDIIKLEPADSYSSVYSNVLKRAKEEIKAGFMPELKPNDLDLSAYRAVFVGSPNWCSTMAPPVKTFLEQNDFTGKKVIPFCTHGGGGAGRIISDIEKESAGAKTEKGFHIYGDGGNNTEELITVWLNEIGIKHGEIVD